MDTKRRTRQLRLHGSEELGLHGAKKPAKAAPPSPEDGGSEEVEERDTAAAVEESRKSSDARPVGHAPAAASPRPNEMPNRAKKPSPPPPPAAADAGARRSGEVSLQGDAPTDELAASPPRKKAKKTTKRLKRPPPLSQEERAQDDVEESGDPSPADETAVVSPRREIVAPHNHNKRGATPPVPKRGKRGATLPHEQEEQSENGASGADDDGTGKSLAKTGVKDDNVNHKKKTKKLGKVLAEPPQPVPTVLGPTGNREDVLDACNTSSSLEKDSAQAEEHHGEEMMEPDHAGNTSLPQVNDGAHEEEQQGGKVAEKENAKDTILPQQKDGAQEDDDMGVEMSGEALTEKNASPPKLRTSEGEKKPAVERSWSQDDELKILTALVEHAKSHEGALPDPSDLLANLTFDKTDANADKLNDKIRKLKARYRKLSSQGRPTDDLGRQLFELSDVLWGHGDDDVQVAATCVTRDFSQRSVVYPYLAEEVKAYAETHSSGHLIMAAFATIGDDEAYHLDAMCKKQRVDALKLELSQTNLTKALLSAFSSQIN